MRTVRLTADTQRDILDSLLKRSPNNYSEYEDIVADIIKNVRENGDQAVFSYTKQFDKWEIDQDNVRVSDGEIEEAFNAIDTRFIEVMKKSADNIARFHKKQLHNSWIDPKPDGSILGQKILPIAVSGVYVPGGKAAYPSSVLMNVIPAKVAGVRKIIMTTPAGADGKVNPGTLAAAKIAGVDEIYKVGGAQAIAAMTFGTESIPKVDKITGPGNIFVALAKKACFGYVSIDSIAEKLAEEVNVQIDGFLKVLPRAEIIRKSLDNYGYILLADSMEDAVIAADAIASEHVEILTKEPYAVMTKIHNAGAIFLGEYSSEPLGDYYAGPNHILPTNGTAKFFSPLNVDDFMKKTSIISYSKEALEKAHEDIELFAEKEGLSAHANSVRVRFTDM